MFELELRETREGQLAPVGGWHLPKRGACRLVGSSRDSCSPRRLQTQDFEEKVLAPLRRTHGHDCPIVIHVNITVTFFGLYDAILT